MKRNDEIRRLLREADPAASRELFPVDRARMRTAITGAARSERNHPSRMPLLAVGVALTAVAIACVVLIPRGEHRSAVSTVRPTSEAPTAPTLTAPAVAPASEPVLAKLPARSKSTHARPRLARLDEEGRMTRIVFTGPEGTKILWFVGTPDAKELGS